MSETVKGPRAEQPPVLVKNRASTKIKYQAVYFHPAGEGLPYVMAEFTTMPAAVAFVTDPWRAGKPGTMTVRKITTTTEDVCSTGRDPHQHAEVRHSSDGDAIAVGYCDQLNCTRPGREEIA
jgi:hypothetical protein